MVEKKKKIEKVINYKLYMSGKKVVIAFRGVLRTQSTYAIELFRENSKQLKTVNYFRKKAPSQTFYCVLNTSPVLKLFSNTSAFKQNFNLSIN